MFQYENNLKSRPPETILTNVVSSETILIRNSPFSLSSNINRKKVSIFVSGEFPVNLFINNSIILSIGQYHFKEIDSTLSRLSIRLEAESEPTRIIVTQYS